MRRIISYIILNLIAVVPYSLADMGNTNRQNSEISRAEEEMRQEIINARRNEERRIRIAEENRRMIEAIQIRQRAIRELELENERLRQKLSERGESSSSKNRR
ncbi:hypothetical protein [Candidatus Liberibacter americanus]|uniref:Uncharacterized protein n=1 Tax=Candidatus Liberibacter americanus str. Sao Paulo TaxID=1261131 RepID=U6B7T1_9HYPH|nr:hypothetical protein [Candidatus Liberibacter americanus]AHA27782.1 hypothetical protein lam_417 [Candidatus Liberibacter americanus str. Sao Paulo]EMS36167.1 hypothetical protein G653_02941 [Candidatus Liberibacter americanus PW_SP]